MSIFNSKDCEKEKVLSLDEQMKLVAKKYEISLAELKKLGEGKKCPKYGVKELLHVRSVRGGKLVVFNISEKFRGEKISIGRKKLKKNNTVTKISD